jgi:NAD(P)-dependent dehydrogenase (short-subunit alcohol dehydrogenase family)
MTSYSDRRRLKGHHVVITGAHGGIGQALCRRIHADGATITAINRSGQADDPLWKELGAEFIALDVGAPGSVIAQAVADVRPLNGLVNMAGVDSTSSFPDYTDQEFARVFNIHTRGPVHLMQTLRPKMQPKTSVVNIITLDALIVLKTMAKSSALYAASKAALALLTGELAAELGPEGIRVNGVAPGLIDTAATAKMSGDRRRWIVDHAALRRIGLCCNASRFITGQVLPVDGGMAAAMYGPLDFAHRQS